MKLNVQIDDRQHEVELPARRAPAGAPVAVTLDAAGYDITLQAEPAGAIADARTYLLTHDGRVYECQARRTSAGEYEITVGGESFAAQVADPRRLPAGGAGAAGAGGARARITSPMPGKIVRVLVEQGAQVEAGAPVVVVEAMKMQNEMKASRAGTVVELAATEGATVAAGDVLAVIE